MLLVQMVESEETLCEAEEGQLHAETTAAVVTLDEASDASLSYMQQEKAFFAEQAAHLYAPLNEQLRREYASHVATLQQGDLRLVRQYNESKVV